MAPWLQTLLAAVCAVFASSGFWAWIMAHKEKKSAQVQMILGLGHDKIIHLCSSYIARGWLTDDEYDNLANWLYVPYRAMKGNGRAKKLMEQVEKLPIHLANGGITSVVNPVSHVGTSKPKSGR